MNPNLEAEKAKEHFEQNLLDGDEVQPGQMLAATEVWGYISDLLALLETEKLKARIDEREKAVNDYNFLQEEVEEPSGALKVGNKTSFDRLDTLKSQLNKVKGQDK